MQSKNLILSNETEVYICTASWRELAIKISIGKINIDLETLRAAAAESGFVELPVLGTTYANFVKLAHASPRPV